MKDIRTTSHNVVGFIENAQGRKLVIGPKTTISEPFEPELLELLGQLGHLLGLSSATECPVGMLRLWKLPPPQRQVSCRVDLHARLKWGSGRGESLVALRLLVCLILLAVGLAVTPDTA